VEIQLIVADGEFMPSRAKEIKARLKQFEKNDLALSRTGLMT
jgi:hypothetical protein